MNKPHEPLPCPHCGRRRATCWTMPCLAVQQMIDTPGHASELQRWVRAGLPLHMRRFARVTQREGA